jgi:hypothetical protein
MANPNIVNVSTIYGNTAQATPSNTSANVLLANASGSGKVYKVDMVVASNIDGTNAVNASVGINSAADGSGSTILLASTISVPANASLILVDKSISFYLLENKSVVVTSGTSSKISFTVSYEDIS